MTTATAGAAYRPPTLRRAVQKAALYIAIIFVTAITIFPIYWMIVSTIVASSGFVAMSRTKERSIFNVLIGNCCNALKDE